MQEAGRVESAIGAVIGALLALFGALVVAHIGQKQKSDELFANAVNYLKGKSQERNVGIATIQLYWQSERHRTAAVQLLTGSVIYLLFESKQGDAAHELFNLEKIMGLLLSHQPATDDELKAYQYLTAAVGRAMQRPKPGDGLDVPVDTLRRWQIGLRQAIAQSPNANSFERIQMLFDYTKFHIGLYTTLASAAVALIGTPLGTTLDADSRWVWAAIAFIGLAGFAGGVIASSLPQFNRIEQFYRARLGPFRLHVMSGELWTYFEHVMFWAGVIAIIVAFAVGDPEVKREGVSSGTTRPASSQQNSTPSGK
jgi:membrane-associated protease RseP (regulator of RpoE activity)